MSIDVRNIAIAKKCLNNGGGGSGITINYIGEFENEFVNDIGTKTIDFKTGQYARNDYSELTEDNFFILPKTKTPSLGGTNVYISGVVLDDPVPVRALTWIHDQWTYNKSTGILRFFGGLSVIVDRTSTSSMVRKDLKLTYKVYIIKPGLSQVIS